MYGHGRPDQHPLRVSPASGIVLLASLIALTIMAGLLCAQSQQPPVFSQHVQQQSVPSAIQSVFPPSFSEPVEQNATSDFSHGYCRVTISWGGGESRVWHGAMRLSDG